MSRIKLEGKEIYPAKSEGGVTDVFSDKPFILAKARQVMVIVNLVHGGNILQFILKKVGVGYRAAWKIQAVLVIGNFSSRARVN